MQAKTLEAAHFIYAYHTKQAYGMGKNFTRVDSNYFSQTLRSAEAALKCSEG